MQRKIATVGIACALALGSSGILIAQGCSVATCEEIHDPSCYDAGNSTEGGQEGSTTDGSVGIDANSDTGTHDGPGTDGQPPVEAGCSSPTTLSCNGMCVDPTEPAHCGTSCTPCPGPDSGTGMATCSNGTCGLGCTPPTALNCSGACVDPSQPANCGSCTNACPGATAGTGDPVCTLGADGGAECTVTCTGATTQVCPASGGSTACYAPTDPAHCGSCTNACPAPPSGNGQATCTGATPACGVSCATGYHVCTSGTDCLSNGDEPSDTADPCVLTETFGVFVKPTGSDTSGTGSRTAPYATIGHAMDQAKLAGLTRVYACGTAGNYTENLVVGSSRTGVTAYGGLDCSTTPATWTYNASDKAVVAPASGYALNVTAAVTFEDFGFVAASATGMGASSIAVFASSATGAVLERCSVTASTATLGQDQTQATQAAPAPGGNPGGASVQKGGTGTGGPQQANPSCPTSIGGAGGSAVLTELDGQSGQVGANNAGTSAECNAPTPQGGGQGAASTTLGSSGPVASDWATFSAAGWTPLGGGTGGPGNAGQGGGGGGVVGVVGPAGGGGGGGAGGCGGSGGAGGSGGGSSIAILAYNSSLTLQACTLAAASAGRGGNGAPGQAGQAGGGGGAGYSLTGAGDACSGGAGGSGSGGGPGGGGAGGISAGVVWTGTAPTVTGGSQTLGTAGAAGQNGDGTTTAKAGTAGGVVQFQ